MTVGEDMTHLEALVLERIVWTILACAGLILTSVAAADALTDFQVARNSIRKLHTDVTLAKYVIARRNLRTTSVRMILKLLWSVLGLITLTLPIPSHPQNLFADHVLASCFIGMSLLLLWDSVESNRDRNAMLQAELTAVLAELDRLHGIHNEVT